MSIIGSSLVTDNSIGQFHIIMASISSLAITIAIQFSVSLINHMHNYINHMHNYNYACDLLKKHWIKK